MSNHKLSGEGAARLYTIDEDYSELIEEGGQWYRAKDYDALLTQLRELRAKVTLMSNALDECEDYFDNRSDVVDGSYGEPAPNTEMRLLRPTWRGSFGDSRRHSIRSVHASYTDLRTCT